MFDLEQAISEWRDQMLAAGISAAALDELDSHLREEVGQQVCGGLSQPDAFDLAVRKIGPAGILKREFRKNGFDWLSLGRKLAYALLFAGGLLCCCVLLLATNPLRSVPMSVPCRWLGWTAIVLAIFAIASGRLASRFLPAISSRRVRSLVQFGCLLPVIIGFPVYIGYVLPNWDFDHFNFGRFLVANVWVFAALPVSYRLCKAFDDAAGRDIAIVS
jgi:hypothetical protein